jgi:hypothetical protein
VYSSFSYGIFYAFCIYCTLLGGLDHFWSPVVPCLGTWDAVRIVNSFYLQSSPTRNYNHSQLFITCVTFTQVTILHANIPFYSSYSLHNTLQIKPSIHTAKLSPRTYSANSLLRPPSWESSKPANRFAYVTRTSEMKNGASQFCCVRSPCLQRSCLGNERGAVWRHRGLLCSNARRGENTTSPIVA